MPLGSRGERIARSWLRRFVPTTQARTAAAFLLSATTLAAGLAGCDGGLLFNLPASPTVKAANPLTGPIGGGTQVTILGTGFKEGTGVLFGDLAATSVEVINQGLLRAVTPAHVAGDAPLVLIDTNGRQGATTFTFTYTDPSEAERPLPPVTPAITSITPAGGPLTGGTEVVIQGSGFSAFGPAIAALFGATPAPSANVISDTEIRAVTPAHGPGIVDVLVVDADAKSASLDAGFTFVTSTLAVTSIDPASGPIDGGTQVTIKGAGFVSGTVVLFDSIGASALTIVNDSTLSVVTPAHPEGSASVRVMAPDGQEAEAPQQFSFFTIDPGSVDSDGDGLSDAKEIEGWDLWADLFGLGMGTDTFGNVVGQIHVTSDPNNPDTDGDGLSDLEEYQRKTDPRKADTDGDGLTDFEEVRRWKTSPISVDTDADSRGPNHNLIPNSNLFDGAELKIDFVHDPMHTPALDATSPTLDDTDGDGRTDFEEYDHVSRSPTISDLPLLELKIVDPLDIRLDVQYAEEQGRTTEYGTTLTESTTHTTHVNNNDSLQVTVGLSATVGGEYSWGKEAGGKVTGSVTASLQTAYTHTWESGVEDALMAQEENSKIEGKSLTNTETAASGSISTGIVLTNIGPVSYHLSNLGMTVRLFQREVDPANLLRAGSFRTLTTLTPALGEGFTLAPGQSTPVLQWQATGVNADRIKDLLRDPHSLNLEQAYYELQTEDGVNYAFLEEVTRSRTATITLDFGDGEWHKFRIATNVNRAADGAHLGVKLGDALNLIGYPYSTAMLIDTSDPGNPVSMHQVFAQVRRSDGTWLPELADPTKLDKYARWMVYGNTDAFAAPQLDVQDIVLHAGDTAMLILVRDRDQDGLYDFDEDLYGTSDDPNDSNSADSDGDGLTDFEEASPRQVDCANPPCYVPAGWDVKVKGHDAYHVYSDPRVADADNDGLSDSEEKAAGTDPNKADTDDDGVPDKEDSAPLVPADRLYVRPGGAGPDGLGWAQAFGNLSDAITEAGNRNSDGNSDNNISEIWVAAGTYTLTASQPLLSGVGIYGGFAGNETKREQRNCDPFSNATVIRGQNCRVFSSSLSPLVGTVVDGFMISNGAAPSDTDGNGGAVLIWYGPSLDVTFRNVHFVTNSAYWGGGGVAIYGNSKDTARLTFESCVLSQNSATDYTNGVGGAVRSESATLLMRDCQLVDNAAGVEGGAVFCRDSDVDLERCTFMTNKSRSGGAIRSNVASIRMESCEFNGNWAQNNYLGTKALGGAIYANAGSMVARNCRFAANKADHTWPAHQAGGGAIRYESATASPSLTNCVFFGNSVSEPTTVASYGAAITLNGVTGALVTNCTIAGNNGKTGVDLYYSELTLQNTIVALNTCPADNQLLITTGVGSTLTLSHCCLDPSEVEVGLAVLKVDPKFVSGWNSTGIPALDSGSPLIDFGNNYPDTEAAAPGVQYLPTIDAVGNPRFVDGNGDGKVVVDIGAYEYQGSSTGP